MDHARRRSEIAAEVCNNSSLFLDRSFTFEIKSHWVPSVVYLLLSEEYVCGVVMTEISIVMKTPFLWMLPCRYSTDLQNC